MTTLREAAQQALEALKDCVKALDALHAPGDSIYTRSSDSADRAEIVLRTALAQAAAEAALAQQAQEPVAWLRRQELADLQTCNYRHLGADSPRIWAPHQPDAPAPELDLVAVYADPPRRAPYTDAPQRKPLTNEQIRRAKPVCAHFESFRAGIRFIEREIGLHA
jgi:hypothetical protein